MPPTTVAPMLVYPDVRAAVAWLGGALDFRERARIGESHRAQLSIGTDGAVIVGDVRGVQLPPVSGRITHLTRVRVDNVDAHYAHARDFGAHALDEPVDREYGERDYTVEDLGGHRWNFSESIRDVAPEEFGCETVEAWLHPA